MWFSNSLALIALFLLCSLRFIECQDTTLDEFFLKASKNIPRIGRSGGSKGSSNDDFENFFLKASKSVPRIGRRNEIQQGRLVEESPNSYIFTEKSDIVPNVRKYPTWSEIAKMYENDHQGMVTDGTNSNKLSNGNYEEFQNEKEYGRSKRTTNYV
nr:ecdysis triggering hormone [Henosepilachna vigintioctomaculata]